MRLPHLTTSRESSPAPKSTRITSAFREAAWTMCDNCSSGLGIKSTVRDERYPGQRIDVAFHGRTAAGAAGGGGGDARPRYRSTGRDHGLRKDRDCGVADRAARRQYARPGAPAATARTVGRATVGVSGPAGRRPLGESATGGRKPGGTLDVALIQSLVRKGVVDDCVGEYGHLVVDECHHLSAQSFEQVARRAKARFVTGLSATVARKDGHHPIIFMQCGPVRYQVERQAQAATETVRAHGDRPSHRFSFDQCGPDLGPPKSSFFRLSQGTGGGRGTQSADLRRCDPGRARRPARPSC